MPEVHESPKLTSTLSFRLFLVLLSSVLFLFVGYSTLSKHLQTRAMEAHLRACANRTGDIIRNSLFDSMLRNERERTHSIITLVGTEPDVQAVRIYNKDGRIMFSSDSMDSGPFDIFIVDLKMPGMDGITLLKQIQEGDKDATVIILTAYASVETAVEALKQGAFDYVTKPVDPDDLSKLVRNALRQRELTEENLRLKERVSEMNLPTPIVAVNCGAIPETLLESELFGHEKGSFTGAQYRRKGKIELANGGTLFLDEIGDITMKMQVDLLRVLETRSFTRLGGNKEIESDFRLVCATNRNLEQLVSEGKFREDSEIQPKDLPLQKKEKGTTPDSFSLEAMERDHIIRFSGRWMGSIPMPCGSWKRKSICNQPTYTKETSTTLPSSWPPSFEISLTRPTRLLGSPQWISSFRYSLSYSGRHNWTVPEPFFPPFG